MHQVSKFPKTKGPSHPPYRTTTPSLQDHHTLLTGPPRPPYRTKTPSLQDYHALLTPCSWDSHSLLTDVVGPPPLFSSHVSELMATEPVWHSLIRAAPASISSHPAVEFLHQNGSIVPCFQNHRKANKMLSPHSLSRGGNITCFIIAPWPVRVRVVSNRKLNSSSARSNPAQHNADPLGSLCVARCGSKRGMRPDWGDTALLCGSHPDGTIWS